MTYSMQVSRVVFKAEEINMRISKVIPQNDHLKKNNTQRLPCVCLRVSHTSTYEKFGTLKSTLIVWDKTSANQFKVM